MIAFCIITKVIPDACKDPIAFKTTISIAGRKVISKANTKTYFIAEIFIPESRNIALISFPNWFIVFSAEFPGVLG